MEPEDLSPMLVGLLGRSDVDGAMALYEPNAVFAEADAAYEGHAEIRSAHERFVEAGIELTLHESTTLRSGDIALVHWSWTVTWPDGATRNGSSAEVLRRQPDDTWRFLIDNSDGPAVIGRLA